VGVTWTDRKRTTRAARDHLFPSAVRSGPAGGLLAWRTGEGPHPSHRAALDGLARTVARVQLEQRRLL
jgi:hypothetical protein